MTAEIYTAPTGTKYDPLALYRQLLLRSQNQINDLLTDWQGLRPGLTDTEIANAAERLLDLAA